jgi:uncharacterized protein (TIGR00251 family)
MTLRIGERAGAVRIDVRVRPRASKSAVLGEREGALDVAVAAPPVDGAANDELVRTIAAALGVPRRDVSVVAGQTGKNKVVEVRGVDAATVRGRLAFDSGSGHSRPGSKH